MNESLDRLRAELSEIERRLRACFELLAAARGESSATAEDAGNLPDVAKRIWERHPKHRRGTLQECERSLVGVVANAVAPLVLASAIDRRHAAWCASEEWTKRGGQYAPGLTRWLAEGGCMREPPEEAMVRMDAMQPSAPPKPPPTYEEQCAMYRRVCRQREDARFFAENQTITEEERAFLLRLAEELPE